MAKNFEVGMILQTKGGKEAQKEIENVQKNIDNLKEKAIELNEEFKKKQSLNYDTKEVEQKLKDVNKQLEEERTLLQLLSEEAERTGGELKTLADRAIVENLQDMSDVLGGFASAIISLGEDAISQAMSIGGLENAIIRLSDSAIEGQKTVDFIKNLSLTEQEFSTESLLKAGEKLMEFNGDIKKLGVSVEDLIPKVSDFADVYMVDVAESAEIVARALSGTRGGVMQLASQYDITTEKLKDYGAELTAAGEIEDDSLKTKQAVLNMLDEFSQRALTASESATEQYENAVAQLNNTFTELKTEVGQEVIPTIVDLTKTGVNLLKWIKDLPPEVKNTTIAFTGLAAGIALSGQAATGIAASWAPFSLVLSSLGAKIIAATASTQMLTTTGIKIGLMGEQIVTSTTKAVTSTTALGSSMGALGAALPIIAVGALIIALGALANAYAEVLKHEAKMKQNDIEEALKRRAEALKGVHDAGIEAGNAQGAYNKIMKEGVEGLEEDVKGLEKVKSTQKLLVEEEAHLQDKRSQDKEELTRLQEELNKALEGAVVQEADANGQIVQKVKLNEDLIKTLQGQIGQQQGIVNKDNEHIQILQDKKKNLIDIRAELEKNNEVEKNNYGPRLPEDNAKYGPRVDSRAEVKDDVLKKKLDFYKDDLDHLRSYFSTYKLTYEQQAALKEAINKKLKESDQEWSQSSREVWDNYIKDLDLKLTDEVITQEQYSKSIQGFIDTNRNLGLEGVNDGKLFLEIKKKLADSEKKIRDNALSSSKKQAEEWKKSQKEKAAAEEEAWKKTIQIQSETLEAEGKTVEAKKLLLKTKEKDLRDSGVAEAEIVKWKEAQIQSIEKEGLEETKKRAEEKLKANQQVEEAIVGISESATERQISSIKKQAEEWEKSGADRIKTEEYTSKAIQKFQEETWQDFKQKEEQKRKEIEDTAKTIQSIDEKIAANKQKIKDLESGSSFGSGSPLMSAEEALSKSFSKHLDPYIEKLEQSKALEQENQALMSERDKAFQKEQEQQSELKKIQDERNKAQDAFNTALQGTVDKYAAVSKSSPWDAEKAKIEAATKAAEEYNNTSKKDDSKKGSGASDAGGGGGGGNDNTNSPQNYNPGYQPQGQGGNNPGSSTQGQGGNLPGNYTPSGFSTAGTGASDQSFAPAGTTFSDGQSHAPSTGSRTDQGWDRTPNYKTGQDLGSWGFDNPVHDSMAFKAMENMTSEFAIPIVTKSMKDMVTNMLGGMVSSVSNILNSPNYNTTNSQVSNYKSMSNITNYNTTLNNKQIDTITPVARDIGSLNALTVKFRKPA